MSRNFFCNLCSKPLLWELVKLLPPVLYLAPLLVFILHFGGRSSFWGTPEGNKAVQPISLRARAEQVGNWTGTRLVPHPSVCRGSLSQGEQPVCRTHVRCTLCWTVCHAAGGAGQMLAIVGKAGKAPLHSSPGLPCFWWAAAPTSAAPLGFSGLPVTS